MWHEFQNSEWSDKSSHNVTVVAWNHAQTSTDSESWLNSSVSQYLMIYGYIIANPINSVVRINIMGLISLNLQLGKVIHPISNPLITHPLTSCRLWGTFGSDSMDIFFSAFYLSDNFCSLYMCRPSCFVPCAWRNLCTTRTLEGHNGSRKLCPHILDSFRRTPVSVRFGRRRWSPFSWLDL